MAPAKASANRTGETPLTSIDLPRPLDVVLAGLLGRKHAMGDQRDVDRRRVTSSVSRPRRWPPSKGSPSSRRKRRRPAAGAQIRGDALGERDVARHEDQLDAAPAAPTAGSNARRWPRSRRPRRCASSGPTQCPIKRRDMPELIPGSRNLRKLRRSWIARLEELARHARILGEVETPAGHPHDRHRARRTGVRCAGRDWGNRARG